ncbi:MAG: CRISPR-associated endonuclease Cas2 [Odoribacteraceae bacterium]|jgi:CRISPR-associated protein Cas2|nr:CRISPR-associated endonuclease Cas2 [Odoribacteraceae bacterium]
MLVVSYDMANDKLRNSFAKMLIKNGALRLQYSVFEVNNTRRVQEILKTKIEADFAKRFEGGDSVFICETNEKNDQIR